MALAGAWLLYPAVATVVALGWGLLLDRVSGGVRPVLWVPLGLAAVVVVVVALTYSHLTAPATLPVIVVGALVGVVLGLTTLRAVRPDGFLLAAAIGVFAIFAAPVVFTGHATFAGYTVLGDTAIHFVGADVLLHHGRDVGGLQPSSFAAAAQGYYGPAGSGYPTGSAGLAGALTSLVGMDVAWTFQPLLALLATMFVPIAWVLLEGAGFSRGWRAFACFVAAQPALVYAYALQGSIKEIGTVYVIALTAALIAEHVRVSRRGERLVTVGRSTVPPLVAAAAACGFVGFAAGVWLLPLFVAGFVALIVARRLDLRGLAARAVVLLGGGALLTYSSLLTLGDYVQVTKGVVTSQVEFGNLLGMPLPAWQALGIWPSGDHRVPPVGPDYQWAFVLIGVALLAVAVGVIHLFRRGAWAPLVFIGVSALAWYRVTASGSPWADAKALMIVTPAILLAAAAGVAALATVRRVEGVIAAAALAFGVLWSNALAYHDAAPAPRDRLAELQQIGDRFAGQGPALFPEFEEFGKHFLRDVQPDSPVEAWHGQPAVTAHGRPGPRFGYATDLDDLATSYVDRYRLIILRRGFAVSRPGWGWQRRYRGHYYEVWARSPGTAQVKDHVGFGITPNVSAQPKCKVLRPLERQASRDGADLVAALRPPSLVADLNKADVPPNWGRDGSDINVFRLIGPGRLTASIRVKQPGRYRVWFEGSASRKLSFSVDGRPAGSVSGQINARGVSEPAGTVQLTRGKHVLAMTRSGGDLAPGNGFTNDRLVNIALEPEQPEQLERVPPKRWRTLCTQSVDWVEVVRGGTSARG